MRLFLKINILKIDKILIRHLNSIQTKPKRASSSCLLFNPFNFDFYQKKSFLSKKFLADDNLLLLFLW